MSTDKWVDTEDVTHTHTCTMEYYLGIKNYEIMLFAATWMDLEIMILSKSDKDKNPMISLICGTKNKMVQINLYTKQK